MKNEPIPRKIKIRLALVGLAILAGMALDQGPGIIREDNPGWNCETMGNRICGPANP